MSAQIIDLARSLTKVPALVASLTQYPWIIEMTYRLPGQEPQRAIEIRMSTLAEMPHPADILPPEAELLHCDVFVATRFDDMPESVRQGYKAHYRAFRMWRKARALGKEVSAMQPHIDYDPIAIDEAVERWATPFGRYAGD